MYLTLHRGAETIGGSCIELSHNDSRVLLDLGFPLMEPGGSEIDPSFVENPSVENGILPDVKGLYHWDEPGIDAVIISHPHIDHYGLIKYIHPSIPVYLSKGAQKIIEIINIFTRSICEIANPKIFEHWKPYKVGAFTIISFLNDHSAYDSSCLLVEAGGKKAFYTGDFRAHGRKAITFERLLKNPPKDVDCLITEGTTIGEPSEVRGLQSEDEVEQEMAKVFKAQKDLSFVVCSGSNVDRLVTLFRATKSTGKTLVLDLYTYHVLSELKKLTKGIPPFNNDHIRVFYHKEHGNKIADKLGQHYLYDYKHRRIKHEEIAESRSKFVLKIPPFVLQKRLLPKIDVKRENNSIQGIYSLWSGYLEKDRSLKHLTDDYNIEIKHIHTSGHAYRQDIERLINAINAKTIIPIHTLSGDSFHEISPNIQRLADGESFQI